MSQIKIANVSSHSGEQVVLAGWLYNIRKGGKVSFLLLRDGTGLIQCVAGKEELGDELFEAISKLTQESSLKVTGQVQVEQRAPGGFELKISGVQVIQRVSEAEPYPLTPKPQGTDFLLDHRHLWLRNRRPWANMRIRSEVERAICDYFDTYGFTRFDTPILTPGVCEGMSTLFRVEYYGDNIAYLADSSRLYLEAAAMALGDVYSLGPRYGHLANGRELTECWMAEVQMPFASLDNAIFVATDLLGFVVKRVRQTCKDFLQILQRDAAVLEVATSHSEVISYTKALEMVHALGSDTIWWEEFSVVDQKLLAEYFKALLVITNFPSVTKSFAVQPTEESTTCLSFEIVVPEGQGAIVCGDQRVQDLELLKRQLYESGLPLAMFEMALDLRKYGSVQQSGFNLHLERLVAWICGLEDVWEAAGFPRTAYRVRP